MMPCSTNEMSYCVSTAHCAEASFSCPFFMDNADIIMLGTILMVSIFISLAVPVLLALLIDLGSNAKVPEEHLGLV